MTGSRDAGFVRQSPAHPITVVIVEDRVEIREGLAQLIDGAEGFRCGATFGSMEDALQPIGRNLPDVVLNDIGLPGMNGIEGIRLLRARHPALPILMLTIYDDDERIFEAICAGASGYLLKSMPAARLLDSLREVVGGGSPMSPQVARRVMVAFRETRAANRVEGALTPHETRVLKLFADGHNYKTAATELAVSVHAISFHLRSIYSKLHVHSKTEAVAKALRTGLV
jgi:DNA-binding NarL/FixJ family response regulator